MFSGAIVFVSPPVKWSLNTGHCTPQVQHRLDLLVPFMYTDTLGLFEVRAFVQGGGLSGQSQAIRHGVAKALLAYSPETRKQLKRMGLLTRDARVVERKKPGKVKARKSPQWVKR